MPGESIAAIVTSVALLALFTTLLVKKRINQPSYIILVSLAALVAIVLHGFPRLEEVDLKELKLTLAEIKEVKQDVYAKARDVGYASRMLADLIALQDVHQGLSGDPYMFQRRDYVDHKTREILATLGVPPETSSQSHDHVLREYREFLQSRDVKIDEQFWGELVKGYMTEKPQPPLRDK